MKILISACLLGLSCRYDGRSKKNTELINALKGHELIPVCPEVYGGLPTPREPSEIRDGRVVTRSGKDMTNAFIKGAEECAGLAGLLGADTAILQDRSPSCGVGKVHNGLFDGGLTDGDGIAAKTLKGAGLKVIGAEQALENGIENI